jgi:hypothetical protein
MKVSLFSKTEKKKMEKQMQEEIAAEEKAHDEAIIMEMERNIKEIGDFIEAEISDIEYNPEILDMERTAKKRSICEVLRTIYKTTDNQEIKELTIEGTLMAKKMSKKLVKYRKEMAELRGEIEPEKKESDNV